MMKRTFFLTILSFLIVYNNSTAGKAETKFYKEKACPNALAQQICKDQCRALQDSRVDIDIEHKIIRIDRSITGLNIGTAILEKCNIEDDDNWSCSNKLPGYYVVYKAEPGRYNFNTILSDGTVSSYNCAD